MKRLIEILVLIAALFSCQKSNINEDNKEERGMFDDSILPEITVSVSLDEWNKLLSLYDADHMTKEYVKCEVSVTRDNDVFNTSEAGLRLRGQTSRRRPEAGNSGQKHLSGSTKWQHCHFMLRSDNGKIILKYAHEDPTYVREHYCWDLAERYGIWTGTKSSYCRLYINVEGDKHPAYFGVYLMIEHIGDQYLEDRKDFFKSDKGFLWKCQWGSNLKDLNDDLFKVDDNSSNERAYELKTGKKHFDKAKEQIRDFITKLNTLPDAKFPSWISSVCDVDFLLKTYAMLVAVGHWDDYWNDMNNYYIFFNSRDKSSYKFFMIPYDLDNTLGTSHNCGVQTDSGRHDPYNWGMDQCPLIKRKLQVPEYKAVYTEYLKDFTDLQGPLFGWKASQTRINSWINLIQPYVPNDTGEDMEIKDRPASWGNHPEYRILSYGKNNWFKVKTESIAEWISKQ